MSLIVMKWNEIVIPKSIIHFDILQRDMPQIASNGKLFGEERGLFLVLRGC